MRVIKEMLECFSNQPSVGDFSPKNSRIIDVHGRPVRCIRIMDSRITGSDTMLWLMIEANGNTWLWDGMVDP